MTEILQVYDQNRTCYSNIRIDKIQCLEFNPEHKDYDATLVSGLVYKNLSSDVYEKFISHCGQRLINVDNLFFVDAKRIQTLSCLEPDEDKNIVDFQVEMVLVSGWTFKASIGQHKKAYEVIEQIWRRTI